MKRNCFLLVFTSFMLYGKIQAQIPDGKLKGEYMGQEKPGLAPQVFAPDFISTKEYTEMSAFFHPNGKEFYFTVAGGEHKSPTILVSKLTDGKWSKPEPLLGMDGMVPIITPDGRKLYFSSIELTDENDSKKEPNIWVMERGGDKWGEPKPLGSEVNTPDGGEWFPSLTDNGTLFFKRSNFMEGKENLFYSEVKNGKHQEAKPFEAPFANEYFTEDPFIAPDKSYVIFSPGGPKLFGPMHISFRNEDGSWTTPKNMRLEGTLPSLSPDRKFLFFIKDEDVYWVDAKVIESLR